jgi:hypothetical protein
MSDSYTNLLYHIVFSTKDRRPLITPAYQPAEAGGRVGRRFDLNVTSRNDCHKDAAARFTGLWAWPN